MGRTIPSFRIASVMEENEWKSFRNSLDKFDRKILDDMFGISLDNKLSMSRPLRFQYSMYNFVTSDSLRFSMIATSSGFFFSEKSL